MNPYLANITPEQRQEMIQKGAEQKRIKQQWAKDNLKLDYSDETHWRELASKHGYRLPVYWEKASSKFVNRFLKRYNLSKEWYEDVTGFKNGNKEAEKNPCMNAVCQVGLLLESYDEEYS